MRPGPSEFNYNGDTVVRQPQGSGVFKTVLSFVLGVGCIALGVLVAAGWVRSHFVADSVCRVAPGTPPRAEVTRLMWSEGCLRLVATQEYGLPPHAWRYEEVPVGYDRALA